MKFSFPQTFLGTISNREYYRDVLQKKRASHAVGYLYFLLLILGVISALGWVIAASMLNIGAPVIEAQKQIVRELYPAELVVTVMSGSVSTNVKEPYAIPFPPQWKRWMDESQADKPRMVKAGMQEVDQGAPFDNIIVIDTSATAEHYADSRALLLVTKNSLVHPSRNSDTLKGNYEVTTLEKTATMTIDRAGYDMLMLQMLPYVDVVIGFAKTFFVVWVIIAPFLIAAFKLASYALYLLLGTLLLWMIDIIFLKKNLRYGEIYRLSLYGLTVPTVVTFTLSMVGAGFPLLFTIIFIAWMTYVFAIFKPYPKAA